MSPANSNLIAGYSRHIDYDPDLEKQVLGICLAESHSFSQVQGIVTEECFYTGAHRLVLRAMHAVWVQGSPVDVMSVTRQMYDEQVLELEGTPTGFYLSSLVQGVINTAHLQAWSIKLRELYARRIMIQVTSNRFSGDDVLEGAGKLQQSLQQALTIRSASDWIDAGKAAVSLGNHIDSVAASDIVGISTGFPTLDALNGGFRSGQLVVIGARPSVGKSALMGVIALGAARQGYKVGILSLEMEAKDIFGRMISADTGLPFAEIDRHGIPDSRKQQLLTRAMCDMAALPLYFSDTAQCTIYDIRARAEQLKLRHGLDILLLDYLQLVEETDKYRNREQGIAQVSRGLKMLAMNLKIPVIALSQLNRESEHRLNKRPTMADLRESGAIEQDADIVMLLHRDWRAGITQDALGNSTENQADLLVYKWRNGCPADLKLRFEPETMRFSEAA